MRHQKAGKKLGRNPSHRLALFRNLSRALIEHERIVTTLPKAKALRPFFERLITRARGNTLHDRRLAMSILGPMAHALVHDKSSETEGVTILQKLVDDIAPRFANRPGGYTRILKLHTRRLGDAGATAIIELLRDDEDSMNRRRKKTDAAPLEPVAPKLVEEKPAEPAAPTAS